MASQTSSTAETSGTNAPAGSNLHHVIIQVDPEHSSQPFYVEMLFDRDWKNEEFLKLLDNYLDDRLKTINFHATAVQEYLNWGESLIQDAEGSSSRVNCEAPLNISHHQFLNDLCGVYGQQMLKQDNLRSFQNNLSQKIHRAQFWIKFSNVVAFFTAPAVLFGTAAAAHAISRKTAIGAVVASSVPILLGTIWRGTASSLNKYMNDVKKYVEITDSMKFGARVIINDLSRLSSSARRFETQMAESSDAGEERKKLVKKSFQELKRDAALFRQDIESAREHTLESVKKHLDSMTRPSYEGT